MHSGFSLITCQFALNVSNPPLIWTYEERASLVQLHTSLLDLAELCSAFFLQWLRPAQFNQYVEFTARLKARTKEQFAEHALLQTQGPNP